MTTLAKSMIHSGADNHPPMLDKDLYDSWKSRIALYMQNREHERIVEHGLLICPRIEENRVTRTKKYDELSATEKIQGNCDMKEINVILQGLPVEIYSLVNHHRVAKDLWEKVQLLMQDLGIAKSSITQAIITNNAAYQVDDLDAYDSDCDNITTAKVSLMANLSYYSSDVLSKVPHSDNTNNDMLNQSVQEMSYSEQTHIVNHPENEITSDNNIILYSQYLLETQNAAIQDTNSSTQQDAMILYVFEQLSQQVTNCNKVNKDNLIINESLSAELKRYNKRVKLLEEIQNVDLSTREKLIINDFEKQINFLKQALFEKLKEKDLTTTTFNVLKNKSKDKEAKNIDKEIALENKVKELDNIVYKMGQSAQTIRPMLYDGNVIAKETNVISIVDSEETLMLEEESRSKMLLKQSDPMVLEKKVNIKPAFWFQISNPSTKSSNASPVKVDVPSELPIKFVNASRKKLKFHLTQFDSMVKKRMTHDALTEDIISSSSLVNDRFSRLFSGIWTPNVHKFLGTVKPMRVGSVNGKKYIIVIVDYYSQFTWVKFLASKDDAPDFIINLEPALHEMTPATPSSGLVPNPTSPGPFVPPTRKELDLVFQPVFGEFFSPSISVVSPAPVVDALVPDVSTGSPSSTTTYKDVPTQACWIEVMQEELNEFERLEVWELVPHPDKVMVITLKRIYKVKLDELAGILKNKARLVARGYRREERIDFQESFALVDRLEAV
uniref:Retrovirus-related Pol polyprotein from transposon TNT 1-94 n=1 Tax=Tanacetum cinerariifolium TaxID=118510 RepID=A0A6L2JTB8_TANCI|nr:retrovirus-related Pol polyprotein from transposon TNT 1-94 [Tanacetum cinerariifolium]